MKHYPECPASWSGSENAPCQCYEIDQQRRQEEIDDRWWAAREEYDRG